MVQHGRSVERTWGARAKSWRTLRWRRFFAASIRTNRGLVAMVIHRRDGGFGGKTVDALRGRVAVLAVGFGELVSMAGMCPAIESSDPSVLKLKILKNAPQPGVLDGAGSILG